MFSIYLLLQLLAGMAGTYSLFQTAFEGNTEFQYLAWYNLAYYGLGLILFIVCWNYPISVAKFMLPQSNDERFPNLNLTIESLELVAFTGIGVGILAFAVPDLGYNIAYYTFLSDTEISLFGGSRGEGEALITIFHTLGKIAVGVLLCFFSGNLKRVILKIRGRT